MLNDAHERVSRWLEMACLGFVALGVLLPVAYASPLFAVYRAAIVAVSGDASRIDGPTARLVVGITGGSIAGKWLAHWAVVRFGVRARYAWAYRATLAGLVSWFVVDSVSSLVAGAWANVVMVNLVPLLVVGPLAWRLRVTCARADSPRDASHRGTARFAVGTAVAGIVAGGLIAFALETPLFAPWWSGLADAHFHGAVVPTSVRALVRFFAGPIGGSTVGMSVLLALNARHAIAAGQVWAPRWSLLAVFAWAVTDSAYSALAGAVFNVFMVNLPYVAIASVPLVWAMVRDASRVRGQRSGIRLP